MGKENKMEEPKFINPEEYLKRVEKETEEILDNELQSSLSRLSKPLKDIEYKDSDTVEVENEEAKFTFSYSSLNEGLKEGVMRYIDSTGIPTSEDYGNPDNWRKLDELIFSIEDTEVDLFSILPPDSKILFCPTDKEFHGAVYSRQHEIYILGNIATLRSIITLLHEIGHMFDDANLRELGVDQLVDYKKNSDLAEKLRRERAASAFALKALRPFFKNAQLKEDSINFIKHYALESYYGSAREKIQLRKEAEPFLQKEYNSAMGDEGVEQREYDLYDKYRAFPKWKKTEAYKQWKAKEENKNLSDNDDFGNEEMYAWVKWIEENNYDYEKDLKENLASE